LVILGFGFDAPQQRAEAALATLEGSSELDFQHDIGAQILEACDVFVLLD
jgi:hypothetical protein